MPLPELGDVYKAAQKVRDNGGDWYTETQLRTILGELVGDPAMSDDSRFIALASPRALCALVYLNAELLAERHEMEDALKEAVLWMEVMDQSREYEDDPAPLAKARAALQRAEGEV